MNFKTYVINLDKYIDNFNKQKTILEAVGINSIRFSAINALENEHLNYKEYIHDMAFILTPKSTIGCALSHHLLIKKLSEMTDDFFLIMEDDAFPIFEKDELELRLINTIQNINILDNKWDIIQLHSDAIFPCPETYDTHCFVGSTAAYLISQNGIQKMLKKKVKYHADLQTSMDLTMRKYRSRENLFWTDERTSLQRTNIKGIFFDAKVNFLTQLFPLRGEKTWDDFLNFKSIRIPGTERELIVDEVINYTIFATILYNSVHIVNNKLLK